MTPDASARLVTEAEQGTSKPIIRAPVDVAF